MACGVDRYCIRKWPMKSLAALLDSVLTLRLVSQSEPAIQWPHLRRGDMEHNRGASLHWRQGDKLGSIVKDHLVQNTITSKHLSQYGNCSTSGDGIHHTDFRPLRVSINSYKKQQQAQQNPHVCISRGSWLGPRMKWSLRR